MIRYMGLIMLAQVSVGASALGIYDGDTRDLNFDERVSTVTVAPPDNVYFPPVMVIDSDQRLEVKFDVLDYDVQYLRYSVFHCDALWRRTTTLVESEWIDGFNYADVTDYVQCEATFTHYYNYSFVLPNGDFRITRSGNYVVVVYDQSDPEHLLFQRRFSVCENIVSVVGEVSSRTDVDYNDEHQQLSYDIVYRPGVINDAYNDLTSVITQNNRDASAVVVTSPTMVAPGRVTYEHQPQLVFAASNEYRRFETVASHGLNMGVAGWQYFDPFYHVTLHTDVPRVTTQYLYDKTQYGHFTIRNADYDWDRADYMSDYAYTHFTLDTGGPLSGGKVVLDGELTRGLPASSTTMIYDASSGCYECGLLLKQGAYNYQYAFVPDGSAEPRYDVIDGNKYQTVNEYLIKVYYHPVGERYDRFVGFGIVYSGR